MRNIKQNLFFAFAYNALGVPIAAGVLYPFTGLLLSPIIAAAAMSLSSVSVIGNAPRLRTVRLMRINARARRRFIGQRACPRRRAGADPAVDRHLAQAGAEQVSTPGIGRQPEEHTLFAQACRSPE